MKRIRLLSCILAVLILMSAVPMTGAATNDDAAAVTTGVDTDAEVLSADADAQEATDEEASEEEGGTPSYSSYLSKYQDKSGKEKEIPALVGDEKKLADDTDSFVMPFTVEAEGFYTLSFDYMYVVRGNKNTTYDVLIDGALPFAEAETLKLSRIWQNETEIKANVSETGEELDDINPKQVEVENFWRSYTLYDKEGYYATPVQFYLSAGAHTLTLAMSTDYVALKNVEFTPVAALPTYDEYIKSVASNTKYDGENIPVQGEAALYKSEMYIIAQNDITNPQTQPYSAKKIKLNTEGGANWKLTGETAWWEVEVPQSGLYKFSIRYRQNFYDGVAAHRRLYVNGVVPYEEANALQFPYETKWQTYTLQNAEGEDLYIYLTADKVNTIALEVMLGASSEIAEKMQASVLELNNIYRDVIMITGSSPDDYRDYNISAQIPTLVKDLTAANDNLKEISEAVALNYGEDSSLIAKIQNITRQMDRLINDPEEIAKSDRLGAFKSNISTIGSWISMFTEQPLEIDRMELYGDNGEAPRADATFGQKMKHKYDRFIASFTEDYSSMGSSKVDGVETTASVNVWIQSGRDQANVLKQQITSSFTPNTGIGVELELVTGAIIEATLAGKGPDIALTRAVTDPVNFAMRDALVDLSQFEDYEEVAGWFVTDDGVYEAMIPFEYKGGVYALPETMSYQMMFVRTDILEELQLELPETWDELLTEVYPIVSRNNMEIGIGNMNQISAMNASNIFTNLLYQMGGQIYNDELTATALDTQVAYDAFNMSVELYADYLFPQEYDAMSRFRTGEMPILLADYTMYNTFSISIPELDGLWEMYPIPGVRQEDGSVNNDQAATETASVMFKGIGDNAEAGWQFLKWWVSKETQAEFGTRIEAVLGAGGRYATANVEAMADLPWNDEQLNALNAQMDSLVFVEQLPGSYFTSRAINSAFMTSVLNSENPTEQLLYWSEQINLELTRKIEEFAD